MAAHYKSAVIVVICSNLNCSGNVRKFFLKITSSHKSTHTRMGIRNILANKCGQRDVGNITLRVPSGVDGHGANTVYSTSEPEEALS